jgi:hypothetical protein
MLKKGNDYANEDRLSNFKMVAQIVGIPIEQVIGVFIATKTVRLGNLMSSGKKPDNESVEDNLLDLANYTQLLEMVRLDEDCKPTTGVLNGTSHIIVNNTKKEIIQ